MGCYIKTGCVHLINSLTDTLSCSEVTFDTVRSGVGAHLEKAVDKILDKHDRRPGIFKPNSKLKPLFEQYSVGHIKFEELSIEIAQLVAESKFKESVQERSMLFILEGRESIYVVDAKRDKTVFQVIKNYDEGKEKILIEEVPYSLPSIRTNSVSFFEVNLKDMSINIYEKLISTPDDDIYLFADVILRADMDKSLNEYINIARKLFYNSVLDMEHAALANFEKKVDIELVNAFEQNISNQLWESKEISLKKAGKVIEDTVIRNKFISKLEENSIPEKVQALSDKPIVSKTIDYRLKKVYLQNGIQVLVPDGVEEFNVKIKEIDGELKEITEAG